MLADLVGKPGIGLAMPNHKFEGIARRTLLFLTQGRAQAGVTWASKALFQEQVGNPIAHVDIPPAQNATASCAGAMVKGAAHPQAAWAWLAFIRSPSALAR